MIKRYISVLEMRTSSDFLWTYCSQCIDSHAHKFTHTLKKQGEFSGEYNTEIHHVAERLKHANQRLEKTSNTTLPHTHVF